MKNFTNLTNLTRLSHLSTLVDKAETKHSPSLTRLWKYLTALVMVLCFGVGNAWGYDVPADGTYSLTPTKVNNDYDFEVIGTGVYHFRQKDGYSYSSDHGIKTQNSLSGVAFYIDKSTDVEVTIKHIESKNAHTVTVNVVSLTEDQYKPFDDNKNQVKQSNRDFSAFSITPASTFSISVTAEEKSFTGSTTLSAGYYAIVPVGERSNTYFNAIKFTAASSARTYDGEEKMYFLRDAWNWWPGDAAVFYAYFWNSSTSDYAWSGKAVYTRRTTDETKDIWEYTVPEGTWDKVIITRHPSGTTTPTFENASNKSNDITLEATTNFLTDWTVYGETGHAITWKNITLASKKVYFDNRNYSSWTTAYVRIGHNTSNDAWGAMTKVGGTKYLYQQATSAWDYHTDFSIADNTGWTGSNNIYQPYESQWTGTGNTYQMAKQTTYQEYGIARDVYLCPTSTSKLERDCQYYNVNGGTSTNTFDKVNTGTLLPAYEVTSSGTHCTVTMVKYTADDFSTSESLSSGGTVKPTQYIGVTVTPDAGYKFSSVSLSTGKYEQHTAAAAGVTGKYAIMADECAVTAACTEDTYTITYKDGGDAAFSGVLGDGSPEEHTYGTPTPLVDPTRDGYEFGGWYTNANFTGSKVTTLTADGYTANITLYAQWTKNVYLKMGDDWDENSAWFATYYFKDGVGSGWAKMSVADACSDPVVYKAPLPMAVYDKLIFVRMNKDKDDLDWDSKWEQTVDLDYPSTNFQFTITDRDGGASSKSIGTWGSYSIPTYTISYNAGTNGSGSKASEAKTCNVDFTLPSSAVFNRTGYTQTGWTTSDGGTQTHELGGNYTTDAAQTFYPVWTAKNYSITYKDGGNTDFSGTHETGYPTSHTYDAATALKKATKTGYAFAGWYTTSTCTGDAITSIGATAYSSNITLYARWVELDLHEPGVYEKPTSEGGYGRPLRLNSSHDYEVYYVKVDSLNGSPDKGCLYAGSKLTISDGYSMFKIGYQAGTEIKSEDGWVAFKAYKYGGSNGAYCNDAEFKTTTGGKMYYSNYARLSNAHYVQMYVQGYDEFAFEGRDCNTTGDNFVVKIDGVTATPSSPAAYTPSTDRHLTRYSISANEPHLIEVLGNSAANENKFQGFSLRLPDVTRYTVSADENNDSYGAVDVTSISSVRTGSTLYVDDNTFTVNGTTVTATPESSCSFVNWTVGGSTPPSTVTGNITMMANFSQSFSVTYNKNGATDGTAPSDATEYESGDKVTVKDTTGCNFVYSGYVFRGWNTENDGSGDFYAPGGKFEISSNTTLYAVWVAGTAGTVTYNLTLNSTNTSLDNCASATPTSGDLTASTDITVYGTAGAVSSQGSSGKETETQKLKIDATYTAANYYEWTCSIASGKTFTPSQVEIKFQAVSDLTQYKIVLTDGTTSYDSAFVQTTSTGNTLETLTWNIAEGDAFAASSTMRLKLWAFKKNDGATAFRLGSPITIKGVVGTAAAADYDLTWDLDGGTVTTAGTGAAVDATGTPSSSVTSGSSITAPTVVKDGYAFVGWSPAVPSTMPASDVTYTAQWGEVPAVNNLRMVNPRNSNIPLAWNIPGICDLSNPVAPKAQQTGTTSTKTYSSANDDVTVTGYMPQYQQFGVAFDIPTTENIEWISYECKAGALASNVNLWVGIYSASAENMYWEFVNEMDNRPGTSAWESAGPDYPNRLYWKEGDQVANPISDEVSQVAIFANAGTGGASDQSFYVRNVRYHVEDQIDIDHIVLMRKAGSAATDTTDASATRLYSGTKSKYTDAADKTLGTTYYYTVFAVDGSGNVSAATTISKTITDDTPRAVTYAKGNVSATGSVPTDANTYVSGNTATLAEPGTLALSGYAFNGWSDGSNIYQPGDSYTMPNHDVTFTAQWRDVETALIIPTVTRLDASNYHDAPAFESYNVDGSGAIKCIDISGNESADWKFTITPGYYRITVVYGAPGGYSTDITVEIYDVDNMSTSVKTITHEVATVVDDATPRRHKFCEIFDLTGLSADKTYKVVVTDTYDDDSSHPCVGYIDFNKLTPLTITDDITLDYRNVALSPGTVSFDIKNDGNNVTCLDIAGNKKAEWLAYITPNYDTISMLYGTAKWSTNVTFSIVDVSTGSGVYTPSALSHSDATGVHWYDEYTWNDANLTSLSTSKPYIIRVVDTWGDNSSNPKVAKIDFTPKKYTLAWNSNGGSDLSGTYTSGSVAAGVAITAPNDPTRTGYDFVKWNSADDGTGNDFNTKMPLGNVTYYAQWEIIDYTIAHSDATNGSYTIKVGDASAVSTNTTGNYNQTVTLVATPSSGYVIDAWNVTGATVGNNNIASTSFTMPAGNVTVAPTFKLMPNVYYYQDGTRYASSTYKTPKGEAASSGNDQTINSGNEWTVSNSISGLTVSAKGCTYDGKSGSEIHITSYLKVPKDGNASDKYVKFVVAAGYKATSLKMKIGGYSKDPAVTLKPYVSSSLGDAISYTGTIGGVATKENNFKEISWTNLAAGTYYLNVGTNNAYISEITAYTEQVGYTVSFAVDGGSTGYGTVSPSSITEVTHGSTVSISENVLTLKATAVTATPTAESDEYTYAFDSWSVSDGASITSAQTITASFTRTAKEYTLTWDLNGGKVSTAGTAAAVDETEPSGSVAYNTALTAPVVTKSGYDFAGWSPSVDDNMPAANTTYTATWAERFTVTYNAMTGSVDPTSAIGSTANKVSLPEPTKDGYDFDGWYNTAGEKIGDAGDEYGPTAAITLYAKWKGSCAGSDKSVRFTTSDKNDAGSYYDDLSSGNTQLVGNGKAKMIATGDCKIYAKANQDGYRADRCAIVFKFTKTTALDIYYCAGSSSRSFALYSFSSDKALADIVVSDYETKSAVTSVTGVKAAFANTTATSSNPSISSGVVATSGSSGGIKATYSSLSAGYYVLLPDNGEGYFYGFDIDGGANPCYQVTYEGNGATSGYVNDPAQYAAGSSVSAKFNSTISGFERTGYEFVEWNTEDDGSGDAYKPFAQISASIAADINLYAQWRIVIDANNTDFAGKDDPTQYRDVKVTKGATLTLTQNTAVRDIIVETGSTLNVSTNSGSPITLSTRSLSLVGGWGTVGNETKYDMPRVFINSASKITKTTKTINFDIAVDNRNFYPIAVPFPVTVSDVDYVNATLAYYSNYGTSGQYVIKTYNGQARANADMSNCWRVMRDGTKHYVTSPGEASEVMVPGQGYILRALPASGYGDYAVIRFPMKNVDDEWTNGEEKGVIYSGTKDEDSKNAVSVVAYENESGDTKLSNKGWNILGVPYMTCFVSNEIESDETNAYIEGLLNITTGEYTEDGNVYVTVPKHDFSEYDQLNFSEAKLLPGWCFFVQMDKDATLTFDKDGERASAPFRATMYEQKPIVKTGIILSGAEASDKTTILVSDKYSAADYEINADLEKMFGENSYTLATYSLMGETRLAYNAMSNSDATNVIPIGYRAPADGEYTFAINPRYAENGAFEHVNLIDYETGFVTDLLVSSYTFATERTQNDERFALNVVKAPQTATDITVTGDGLQVTGPQKVIINDKLYIIVDGKMYSAEGALVK